MDRGPPRQYVNRTMKRQTWILWGISPHGGPAIRIAEGSETAMLREMNFRKLHGWTEVQRCLPGTNPNREVHS